MKKFRLRDMERGWFVGDFSPACLKTKAVEVGVKTYAKGERAEPHFHKIATEITVIISGRAKMNGRKYGPGDILLVKPGETAAFSALEDVKTVVVKLPGALNDKYPKRAREC